MHFHAFFGLGTTRWRKSIQKAVLNEFIPSFCTKKNLERFGHVKKSMHVNQKCLLATTMSFFAAEQKNQKKQNSLEYTLVLGLVGSITRFSLRSITNPPTWILGSQHSTGLTGCV